MVEESRVNGAVYEPLNSTFLDLIPKMEDPSCFGPISLCNLIYQIIAKIIVVCMKPILPRNRSKEQVGFLDRRQIHEAIRVA